MAGRTTVVVAHRLSTIRKADRVLVLEDGQIVEEGRHDELIERGGRYRELYLRQFDMDHPEEKG
jgi:ABC-type multidrug transport system fused ATPase/permease subunit